MTKREYLYSYGSRRHIATPWDGDPISARTVTQRMSFCLRWFETEVGLRTRWASWGDFPSQITAKIEVKKALPVCKLCETRATKSGVIE